VCNFRYILVYISLYIYILIYIFLYILLYTYINTLKTPVSKRGQESRIRWYIQKGRVRPEIANFLRKSTFLASWDSERFRKLGRDLSETFLKPSKNFVSPLHYFISFKDLKVRKTHKVLHYLCGFSRVKALFCPRMRYY